MAEIKTYTFSYDELVEMLIRKQDLHEGLWGIYVEFGFGVANVPTTPDAKLFAPAAINTVNKIGIQRFDTPSNLTIDAAKANPLPPAAPVPELPLKEEH